MRVYFLLGVLLLGACGNSEEKGGAHLLDREKFRTVLLEAQLVEARMNHELVVRHEGVVPTEEYYAQLFKEQGVTKEQFEATFDHYADRPMELKAIYEEIITELSKRKDQAAQ